MITIPGWVLVVLTGLGLLLLGTANALPLQGTTRRVLAGLAALDGAVVLVLGFLLAASA